MVIQRRLLLKIAAGAVLCVTGGSFLIKNTFALLDLWQQHSDVILIAAAPKRNPDIIAKRQGQETILHSRSQHADILKLNYMAGHIWEMCDGSRRVDDIIKTIRNRFDVVTAECRRDVIFTVMNLQQRGLLR